MSDGKTWTPPLLTDDDVRWAAVELGLKADAFLGSDGQDTRGTVFKLMERRDIAACPGSGKTALLVAKLAALSKKWADRTRGICVLSHTNIARWEIEDHLGHTAAGQRLLGYPHFIGTIHGFLNEFLALPYLHSIGLSDVQFSTEIAGAHMWRLSNFGRDLPGYIYRKIRHPDMRKSAVLNASYVGKDLDIHAGSIVLKRASNTPAFNTLDNWKEQVRKLGFATHNDSIAYAHKAVQTAPFLADALRQRFPILFLDEAQDTSDAQAEILHLIFSQGPSSVIVQRYGDSNQAIFDHEDTKGVSDTTIAFPQEPLKTELVSSHRFGQKIAHLAAPLGLVQHVPSIQGNGPRVPLASGQTDAEHTIFTFNDSDGAARVLPCFGDLLLDTFSTDEIERGLFKAVGQVHREKGNNHFPVSVSDYWSDYDSELTASEPRPKTFIQYLRAAERARKAKGLSFEAVNKIAEGVVRLAGMGANRRTTANRLNKHRFLVDALKDKTALIADYNELICEFAVKGSTLTQTDWAKRWCNVVAEAAATIAGEALTTDDAASFLSWPTDGVQSLVVAAKTKSRSNIYIHERQNRTVNIQVGSIHSVKGQTHTATLVLETFWHAHNIESIVDWLINIKKGGTLKTGVQNQNRLKTHYVAMTRPTHLVCLAMKQETLDNVDPVLKLSVAERLRRHGWKIKEI